VWIDWSGNFALQAMSQSVINRALPHFVGPFYLSRLLVCFTPQVQRKGFCDIFSGKNIIFPLSCAASFLDFDSVWRRSLQPLREAAGFEVDLKSLQPSRVRLGEIPRAGSSLKGTVLSFASKLGGSDWSAPGARC
jgi:hypothetical protein